MHPSSEDLADDSILLDPIRAELYGDQLNYNTAPTSEQISSESYLTSQTQPDQAGASTSDYDIAMDMNIWDPSIHALAYREVPKTVGVEELYESYRGSFADPIPKEVQMERAKALAWALLERHYATDQEFTIEPVSFDVMAKHGWSFLLKDNHDENPGQDSESAVPSVSKANRSKGGSKAGKAKKPASTREYNYFTSSWHRIEPEHIAGFVVQRRYTLLDNFGQTFYQNYPHTYLGIMIDDLSTFPNWNPLLSSSLDRGDLLSFSLGVEAKIEKGYGVLILGPRMEFYDYKNSARNPVTRCERDDWAFDIRTTPLEVIDVAVKNMAAREVLYQNSIIASGPRVDNLLSVGNTD